MTRKEIFKRMINLYRNSSSVEKCKVHFKWRNWTPTLVSETGSNTSALFQALKGLYIEWRSAPENK